MFERQAVVLIHGIGEQKPMDTLRGFVDTVWRRDIAIHHKFATERAGTLVWSKPDTVSESFELRRLTTPQSTAGIRTDFFEFYWQHLMQGTTYGHVFAWARSLLLRKPSSVPSQLKPMYWLLMGICLVAASFAAYAAVAAAQDRPLIPAPVSALISVALLPAIGFVIKSIVGDAARYLHVAPPNVQCRHEIRQAGVKLLETLHERGYGRVIIVGHSLGSVIGYDILTHAWPDYHRQKPASAKAPMTSLDALERLASDPRSDSVPEVQSAQRAYFNELVENDNTWRVTDFVTLGSPLAHAAILLASDRDTLTAKQNDREFPTCLPVLETVTRDGQAHRRFSFELGSAKANAYRVPHHAAVFAPTRWTNLYFPSRMIVRGDLIGGPLSDVLGSGIRDVSVQTAQRWGFFSHTLYWRMPGGLEATPHIQALRNALDLTDSRQ